MENSLNFNKLLAIWKKIADQYNITWKNSFLRWDLPDDIKADFTLTLALPIAHKIQQSPHQVATTITKSLDYLNFESTITEQGYINFRFPTSYYQKFLWKTYQTQGENLAGEKKNVNLNIEYVSANPTGYLHLAHFRHAAIGNTLANIYQFLGYNVVREYYINDKGNQIFSLVMSVFYLYCELQKLENSKQIKAEYLGNSSKDIAQKLIDKYDDKLYKDYNNSDDEKFFNVWGGEILDLILTKIQEDLEKYGIKFDVWFSEKSLYKKNNDREILDKLDKKGLICYQNGATLFRSTLGGDEKDRVIIKQNGEYTYFFSDILYHQNKLKRSDRIINVWGADHHGYLNRVKAACQLLDYKPENMQIILVQTVNLLTKEGETKRFSKRLGNTIELEETLQYLAIDQLKFFLLEKDPNQPLSLNTELLKENQEKTRLYYIQYAHARCHQIFQKAQEKSLEKISSNIDLLKEENERKIFNLLIRFPFILENIIEENKPHHLIHYLYEVAQVWQFYYQNSIILDPKNWELTSQKLLLVKNIQIILKLGLKLMGIEAPERM